MSVSTRLWCVKFFMYVKTIYHGLGQGSGGDSHLQLPLESTQGSSYSSVKTGSGTRQDPFLYF